MLERLENFVALRASRPLWAFGWTAFLGALYFVASFYVSVPETLATLDRERTSIGGRTSETLQVRRVYDAVLDAWSSTAEASHFYREHLVGRSTTETLSVELVTTGLNISSLARRRIATTIGIVGSIEFTDAQLNKYAQGIQRDLKAADRTMSVFALFFVTYSSGRHDQAFALLREADADVLGSVEESAAALTRVKSWAERADVLINQLTADADLLEARRWSFGAKSIASILALAYAVGFAFISIRVWMRTKALAPGSATSAGPPGVVSNREVWSRRRSRRESRGRGVRPE